MQESRATRVSMYCRQCGYMLFGLSEDRCPECGQPFDPADRSTFRRYPPTTWGERVVLVLLVVVALAASVIGGGGLIVIVFVLLYWWQRARRRQLVGRSRPAGDRESLHRGP